MNVMTANQFELLWNLGYHRLCPIIPPGAPISDKSTLFKRLQKGDDARGKMPGKRWPDGTWSGFDFVSHESTYADLSTWNAMGAGVGIKTGSGLVLFDADTINPEWADTIAQQLKLAGLHLPVRIGRAPKVGYLVRTDVDFKYTMFEFGPKRSDNKRDRVEILAEGKQFVASGIHPGTMAPYKWPDGVPKLEDVPFASGSLLTEIMDQLRRKLPEAGKLTQEGAAADASPRDVVGHMDTVRAAVKALPNTSNHFPSRESYRDVLYAIKAASGPDNEAEALDLAQQWAARWTDGENDPDVVEADFRRMKPPFRRGASWLYEQAETHGEFSRAIQWFEEPSEMDNLFPEEEKQPAKPLIQATVYSFPSPSLIPMRREIYAQHYYRKFVSATVAPSGVGKTALEIVEALAMSSGKPLLGITPKELATVWLWNGEDPRDELERRTAAAMMHYGLTREDIDGRFLLDTGREQEIIMATETRDGARISAPMVDAMIETIRANKVDVFQLDPFVSSHRVSENDNGAIDMVTKQWAKIADVTGCAIELVHHVRKLNGGEITVEDSRGAVALLATSRSARALTKMSKVEAQKLGVDVPKAFFRFGDAKNNLALPVAGEETRWLKLTSVLLGNGEGADAFEKARTGDSVGVVTVASITEDVAGETMEDGDQTAVALSLVGSGEWKRDVRAGDAWVGVAIANAFDLDLDDADEKAKARQIVKKLLKDGALKEEFRHDKNRNMRCYIVVGLIQNVEKGAFE